MSSMRLGRSLILLALGAPSASAQTDWIVSGSGPDMKVSLEARTTTPPATGRNVPRLVLSCRENEAEIALVMGPFFTPDQIRFDRDPATAPRLHHRTKFGGLFDPNRKVVDPETFYFDDLDVLRSLLTHQSLLLRSRIRGIVQDAVFDLDGLGTHLGAFELACAPKRPLPRPDATTARAEPPSLPPPPTPPPAQAFGDWKVVQPISPLDDKPVVLATVAPRPTPADPQPRPIVLVLRCRGGVTDGFLDFGWSTFTSGYLAVQVSVDGGAASEWWLSPGAGGRAFFFGSGPQLLKRLLASKELHLTLGPKKPRKGDAWMPKGELTYALAGLDGASRTLRERCPIDLAKVKVKDGLGPLP